MIYLIGQIIDNRYEIINILGGGGMALVYKGMDRLLSRTVTVKVLREQFSNDPEVVRRFQKEAQAVAKLSHPNIVSIYDVGQEQGLYYLIMEYIEGQTLKEIIEEKGRLTASEAAEIGVQICDALQHAHESNVIHRDIKPQNILVTPRGQAKVTDFGIAQAASSTTLTYSGNSIIGTVQYISPEQARGEVATVHTDIYSAGIVLYEMVTGRLPFEGDTAIGIAIKHIQADYPKASTLVPDLPPDLEEIINQAMAKRPVERFTDAKEMKNQLMSISGGQGKPLGDTQRIAKVKKEKKARRPKPAAWVLLFLVLALVPVLAYLGIQKYLAVSEVEVPPVTGLSLKEAGKVLAAAGLQWEEDKFNYDSQVPKNHIMAQKPGPGDMIKKTRPILLTISLGPELNKVPDVIGLSERVARVEITNAGFKVGEEIGRKHTNEIAEGHVTQQEPGPNEKASLGTEVTLTVSLGPQPRYIAMPSVIGKSLQEAKNILADHYLETGEINNEISYEYFSGQVVRQDVPPGDQVLQKTTVNLFLSLGPGPTPKMATVQVRTRDDGNSHQIRIVIADQKGEHEEYNAIHEGNDLISIDVPYFGKGQAKVYEDGELIHERALQ